MKPGRELDARIAEKLMGWTEIKKSPLGYAMGDEYSGISPNEQASPYTGFKPRMNIPRYSTEIAAAWLVIEMLTSRGWDVIVGFNECRKWSCVLRLKLTGANEGHATQLDVCDQETAPHSISLAALKTIEQE